MLHEVSINKASAMLDGLGSISDDEKKIIISKIVNLILWPTQYTPATDEWLIQLIREKSKEFEKNNLPDIKEKWILQQIFNDFITMHIVTKNTIFNIIKHEADAKLKSKESNFTEDNKELIDSILLPYRSPRSSLAGEYQRDTTGTVQKMHMHCYHKHMGNKPAYLEVPTPTWKKGSDGHTPQTSNSGNNSPRIFEQCTNKKNF